MQTFLEEIADQILASDRAVEQLVLVLPSRRAKRYLTKALSEKIANPLFPPKLFSIEEFVQELSGLQVIKAAALHFHFYEVYSRELPKEKQQTFEAFLNWGPLLLKDFNDLDAHLAPVNDVFHYLKSLEEIKSWAKEGAQRSSIITNYLDFWKQAPQLYHAFYAHLMEDQIGYLGMLFREAVENLEFYLAQSTQYHYFIGFNALNKAEAYIIQEILDAKKGRCFWDIDRLFYDDPQHHAGKFIRNYFQEWKHLRKLKTPKTHNYFSSPKTFYFIASSKSIAQAKYAAERAATLYEQNPDQKIALVLSDESLLIPTLSGLPSDFEAYNVSMGYPLAQAPQTGFFRELIRLHLNSSNDRFLFSNLRLFLHTPHTKALLDHQISNWSSFYQKLELQNRAVVARQDLLDLEDAPLLELLFGPLTTAADLLPRLQAVCSIFYDFLGERKGQNIHWERYCLQRFEVLFEQIATLNKSTQSLDQLSVLQKLLEEQLALETIDLSGSPINGIQIIGVLETRLLDFDIVVMTDVNEGILPAGKKQQSFLPFEIKKNYELPTFLEQDAIYTYHFYRLIQRASTVYLIYNSAGEGLHSGEPSRFLYQLEILPQPQHKIIHQALNNTLALVPHQELERVKTNSVLQQLADWSTHGVSPSALTTYLRDPQLFYERYILQLSAPPTWSLVMEPRESGTILHDVLETLYTPYLNERLTEEAVENMAQDFEGVLLEKYKVYHQGNSTKHGKNHLIFEALKVYGASLFHFEKKQLAQGHAIEIIALEQKVSHSLTLPKTGEVVLLKGIIDRVDRFDGQLRIIDYKTGKIKPAELKVKNWEGFLQGSPAAATFQLLTYAYMYSNSSSATASAGIYALQNTQHPFVPLYTPEHPLKSKQLEIISPESLNHFSQILVELLQEIMDPTRAFASSKK